MKSKESTIYLNDLGIVNALGLGKKQVMQNLLTENSPGMGIMLSPMVGREFYVGAVKEPLPSIDVQWKSFDCRNNQLLLAAAHEIEESIILAKESYSPERIGVVIGTSTSGVAETELFFKQKSQNITDNTVADNYDYKKQEAGSGAEFIAKNYGLKGPAYVISTACSSSGKAFASARGLIELGICDVVIVGGADSLCELTLSGFKSLEAASDECSNPFSLNRKGINIGEAAALFLMSKEPGQVSLAGVGESSDAHHISAPDPSGAGAKQAMLAALTDAGLEAIDINYVNAHGTGTKLNDSMESHAIFSIFNNRVVTSSTKPLTGHTLGAAGATEAGLCWLLLHELDNKTVVKHTFDGQIDPELSKINLSASYTADNTIDYAMSNSFAFGGSNVSVILARNDLGKNNV